VQDDFQTLLRATGETERRQESMQDWLELDEGDPGFQHLTEDKTAAVILYNYFYSFTHIHED
jgi:hypothetical protein